LERNGETESSSLYVAGALALTDPGPAAAGVFIAGPSGRLVSHRAYYLGYATAREAALRAVLVGVRLARELGLASPRLLVDERWLLQLLRSRGDVPPDVASLAVEARQITQDMAIVPVPAVANPARVLALAPLIQWLPERTRRAERLAVRDLGGGDYEVASESQPGLVYQVHLPPPERVAEGEQIRCECPDFQFRGIPCKHLLMVAETAGGRERLFYPEAAGGPGIPAGAPEAESGEKGAAGGAGRGATPSSGSRP
jgi:hypothetical protein